MRRNSKSMSIMDQADELRAKEKETVYYSIEEILYALSQILNSKNQLLPYMRVMIAEELVKELERNNGRSIS